MVIEWMGNVLVKGSKLIFVLIGEEVKYIVMNGIVRVKLFFWFWECEVKNLVWIFFFGM